MNEGTISKLISDKGFGFISREGEEKDLFFHTTEVKNVSFEELREGDKVTFEVSDGPKGPNATDVNKVISE
jgi:CspA family cold shock protein